MQGFRSDQSEKINPRQDLEEFKISPGEIMFLKNRNSTLEYIKSLKIYRVESG